MIVCAECGQPGFHREVVDVASGTVIASGVRCDACWAADTSEASELRRQFEELLSLGVSRAAANETMIARLDAKRAAKESN